jgi:5'-nucleotidase
MTWFVQPLAQGKRSLILDHAGVRIGLMGLVEREWLDTLTLVRPSMVIHFVASPVLTIFPGDLRYDDFIMTARTLAAELRAAGAQVVIALTHMRQPNDEALAAAVQDIDLVLGGHDHDVADVTVRMGALDQPPVLTVVLCPDRPVSRD